MFIFNFNYIKDLARITMDEKCNGIYCEAETDRYQIAKNSYNLLMPNDVFNSKTYTIFVFIISIMIFIYYYRMLVDFKDNPKISIIITLSFFIILIIMIVVRYVPNDEQGYENYYKNVYSKETNAHRDAIALVVTLIVFIIALLVFQVLYTKGEMKVPEYWNWNIFTWEWFWNWNFFTWGWLIDAIYLIIKKKGELFIEFIKLTCFFISITLVFNLMNIVMTFRKNTTPILKTKPLTYSLRNSLNNHVNYRYTPGIIDVNEDKIKTEYTKVVKFQDIKTNKENIKKYIKKSKKRVSVVNTDSNIFDDKDDLKTDANLDKITIKEGVFNGKKHDFNDISSGLDIYIAFEELSKIIIKSINIRDYITKLKKTINMSNVEKTSDQKYSSTLSLIFDKEVSIPNDYGGFEEDIIPLYFSSDHNVNSNDRNTDYEYTADISYDNANVFYEKYWDMRSNDDPDGNFLDKYFYFVPTNLNLYKGANLYRFMTDVLYFIGIVVVLIIFICIYRRDLYYVYILYEILFPLIAFVVFVTYIIVFIRFNTNFNKNVVYKCLDCSYKRSLNKLNTIVSPYIRMYDNKITGGNKNYTHHYIIANVFYSILSGNINLLDNTIVSSVKVTNGGSGYKSAPNVVFNPSGATATAILGSGDNAEKVISINVTNGGSYATAPIISFTGGGGGSGAEATANITGGSVESISINNDIDYNSYILNSKLADMDSNILTNENLYREYYKTKFKDLYNIKDKADIDKIYKVFTCVFGYFGGAINKENIDVTYFKTHIINRTLISKIYLIIKRCIQLFEEELKEKPDILKHFKFYKNKGELIPHKFILILKTKTDYDTFINKIDNDYDKILKEQLNISDTTAIADMTSILNDITDEDSTNQKKDIQSKCIIKIIAKYLLIMGHINYNRIDYIINPSTEPFPDKFSIDTLGLYKLISNVSYADTFIIDDTFGKDTITKQNLLTDPKYNTLTYMYNYLDTKYVILSSNNNNNYLLNIIKSINNTLNNDNKTTIANDIKESRYLFRDRINDIAPEKQYENEDAILMKAHYISTTSFEATYFVNMLIILFYIVGTVFIKIK